MKKLAQLSPYQMRTLYPRNLHHHKQTRNVDGRKINSLKPKDVLKVKVLKAKGHKVSSLFFVVTENVQCNGRLGFLLIQDRIEKRSVTP